MSVNNHTSRKKNIHNITKIAVLTAISAIIMLFEFPLWFAPGFYKLDLSEAVILMGGFAMGPVAAAVIELLKNLINILLNGTSTAYIGEFANFITGCAFVVPASLIYTFMKNRKGALLALGVGTLSLAAVGGLLNYFVLVPAFSKFYNMPLDTIIGMGTAVNPLVTDLKTLVVFAVAPFNLVKGILCAAVNLLLYKRVSKILHI
ncbi:MAG: ECF transporter S component [Clostridia bacterium]|nr:ECF transporter S component [Clostridia bacterium]